jgi:hypothetical protein
MVGGATLADRAPTKDPVTVSKIRLFIPFQFFWSCNECAEKKREIVYTRSLVSVWYVSQECKYRDENCLIYFSASQSISQEVASQSNVKDVITSENCQSVVTTDNHRLAVIF